MPKRKKRRQNDGSRAMQQALDHYEAALRNLEADDVAVSRPHLVLRLLWRVPRSGRRDAGRRSSVSSWVSDANQGADNAKSAGSNPQNQH